mmetsp:Transcript_4963/g.15148  ORF Transcript_4963/g.15148 Transcript_4963/m.15148 type:complete len:266 (+) Transcript_4963:2193-2990(+)|eukprot:CAMPEP_0177650052 /NCGR_PEP_ID=MMETSP0447-20121125/11724_1 /TAXON_ID=0 /ORGANISM="Stygamoeba regulata, Strain BSH-02190019" /LENGTH=265 /DNA_ID=CAMNT_0019152871 /DNA_START=103 /DNA_END=900 /DNA_ORIENTATION=+
MSTPSETFGQRYRDRVAVVTASSTGIGLAIAERFAAEGGSVVISSRKQENVDAAVAHIAKLYPAAASRLLGVVCHVANAEHRRQLIERTVERFGQLDVLVSNAAINPTMATLTDTEEAVWDKLFEVNVKAAYLLVREALPHLRRSRHDPCVLIVASIGGYNPFPLLAAYSVTKTALLGLTKALAAQLAPEQIRVNGLAPGIIKTRFSAALWQDDQVAELSRAQIPLGRHGLPVEMAGSAAYLCSKDASYVTGETHVAAGGVHARL